jgi:tRNA-modifying protein YgfZ
MKGPEAEVEEAVLQEWYGRDVPRHYGRPDEEYRAALESLAVIDRSWRSRLHVTGRAPVDMFQGIITNSVPPLPEGVGEEVVEGRAAYAAVLTRKGKMVTDLRVMRAGDTEEAGLLLDLPLPGAEAGIAHFRKYLPPRMARMQDVSDAIGMLTLAGPEAAGVISREALGLRVEASGLEALAEDAYLSVGSAPGDGSAPLGGQILVLRSGDLATPAFDVLADRPTLDALRRRLLAVGARSMGRGSWETLRVEAGRPAFGAELTEDTIPVEAGIQDRAIDYAKGCYTGQEVIIRIRDRGRVNRVLRGLLAGDVPTPPAGAELFMEGGARAVGRVTSAVLSPRAGQCIALAYVRREVEPGAEVRVGAADGMPAEVRELGSGWAFQS